MAIMPAGHSSDCTNLQVRKTSGERLLSRISANEGVFSRPGIIADWLYFRAIHDAGLLAQKVILFPRGKRSGAGTRKMSQPHFTE